MWLEIIVLMGLHDGWHSLKEKTFDIYQKITDDICILVLEFCRKWYVGCVVPN